jgi:hypothetical protein
MFSTISQNRESLRELTTALCAIPGRRNNSVGSVIAKAGAFPPACPGRTGQGRNLPVSEEIALSPKYGSQQ